jgi:hypothetical protein
MIKNEQLQNLNVKQKTPSCKVRTVGEHGMVGNRSSDKTLIFNKETHAAVVSQTPPKFNIYTCFAVLCLFCLLCLSLSTVVAVDFFDEYVYGDTVHFTSCHDQLPQVTCLAGKLTSSPWNESCVVYALESTDLFCKMPQVIVGDNAYLIPIRTTVYPLLDFIYFQMNITSASEISQGLLIKSVLGKQNITLSEEVAKTHNLTYLTSESVTTHLRDLRNDAGKCWPGDECSIKETVDILYNLHVAGFDVTNRVYQDALLYISSRQIKANPNVFLEIRAIEDAECNIRKGPTSFKQIIFEGTTESYEFVLDATQPLNITCDTSFRTTMYDSDFNVIFSGNSKYYENSDRTVEYDYYEYLPKAGCIPYRETIWDQCDYLSTAKYVLLNGILIADYNLGKAALDRNLQQQRIGKRLASTEDISTNAYAYAVTKNEDLYTWILFNQKNGGSFEFSEDATLETLRLLNETNEWTVDAKYWLTTNQKLGGWPNMNANILTTLIFEPAIDPIRTDPSLLATQSDRLRFTFVSPLINPNTSTVNVTSTKISFDSAEQTGIFLLRATDDGLYNEIVLLNERLIVPLVFSRQPKLEIELQDMYYVTQEAGFFEVRVKPSTSIEQCRFEFDSIFGSFDANVQDGVVSFSYEFEEFGEYSVPLTYLCTGSYVNASGMEMVYVVYEKTPPIKVSMKGKGTEKSPYVVRISNQLEREIDVTLTWASRIPTHELYTPIALGARQNAEFPILQTSPSNIPEVREVYLLIETLGFTEQVLIVIDIREFADIIDDDTPHVVIKDSTNWNLILLIVGGFLLLIIVLWSLFLKNTQLGVKQGTPEPEKVEVTVKGPLKLEVPDKKHAGRAVEVFIELKRSLGKTDKEIVADLLNSGYAEDEVLLVLDDLNKVEGNEQRASTTQTQQTQQTQTANVASAPPSTQNAQSTQLTQAPQSGAEPQKPATPLDALAKQIEELTSKPKSQTTTSQSTAKTQAKPNVSATQKPGEKK